MPNLITQRYSDEELEQMRASLRDSLEKTDKGGTANSIRNCVIVFENDPLFAGKIMRNLLTETDDMIGEFPWRRDTTRFDDQDLPHVLLHITASAQKNVCKTPSEWWPALMAFIRSGTI